MIVAVISAAAAVATILAVSVHFKYGLYLLGVTGSVACGKSTFCDALRRAGQKVIDLDEITHKLQLPGTPTWDAILKEFSESSARDLDSPLLDPVTKAINRTYLSQLVFQDRRKLNSLNRIMRFPILKEMLSQLYRAFFLEGQRIVYLEAPLLFESGLSHICDLSITIETPLNEQLTRIKRRLSCNESEARARIEAHMPQSEKIARSDIVIHNTGTKQDLHDRALHLIPPLNVLYNKMTIIVWITAAVISVPIASLLCVIIGKS